MQLAKECEAMIQRGLRDLAERRRREEEKYRLLREVADEIRAELESKQEMSKLAVLN